jgi:hypothetical protein
MPDHEARGRAVYDHDNEEPRTSARRRRPAADWGVGEELFDHMPRRRFARDEPHGYEDHDPQIPRGGADDGRRTIVIGDDDAQVPPAAAPPADTDAEFASREEALRAREQHDAVWAGAEPFAPAPRERVPELDDAPAAPEFVQDRRIEGRRTVKIGGRPGELAMPARRRPPRTVSERVGHRPARFAAWAFALGLLLILIAVATAMAGT